MTAWMVAAAVRRHLRMALTGILLTLLAMGLASRAHGVYYQQVYVVLLAPNTADQPNTYRSIGRSLVAATGLLARQVDPTAADPGPVSNTVTMVDQGLTHGYRVRMPNAGGQWSYNFERPELDVQVAGDSPEQVKASMAEVLARIRATLTADQRGSGSAPSQLIGSTLSPPDPPVYYARGSRVRALFGILVLGVGLTLSVIVWLDQWMLRRILRRSIDRDSSG